jgi:dihydropteroate synthase
MFWNLGTATLDLRSKSLVMGILNCTPDSFSDGGAWNAPEAALARALQMVSEGADLIDIGGESSRPGATPVSESEEINRILPVIEQLSRRSSVWISVDTRKPRVAEAALEAGARIVNDIGGLRDPAMRATVAKYRAGAMVMHMQGSPETMQEHPRYDNVVREVSEWFAQTLATCAAEGLSTEHLVLDPGIGFGKTLDHNLALLSHLADFRVHQRPLALGVSRKSFIGQILRSDRLEDRSWPTVGLSSYARSCGVSILRVHDVLPNVQSVRMTEAILEAAP